MSVSLDTKIEAKEIYFKDLLGQKFAFQIPGYQRLYSWDKDNINQLFDDIRDAIENDEKTYFLGSVILQAIRESSDGSGVYDVVDGQQRLITLTILLAVMRDLTQSSQAKQTLQAKIFQEADPYENKDETIRLRVRDRDFDFFKYHILEEGGTLLTIDKQKLNEPQDRMVSAINIYIDKFCPNGKRDDILLDNMIKYILNKCIFVYVKTGTLTSAFRLFSILNDRGMPLTNADLLKSTNLGAIPESQREKYQNMWETIEEEINQDELEKLLAYIRLILVKEKARKTIMEEYEQKVFTKKPALKGELFIRDLKNFSDIYREKILDASISSADEGINAKYYCLMSLMRDFIPFSDWIPVFITYVQKYSDGSDVYAFLRVLEKRFVVSWLKGITPTNRITEAVKMIQAIENSKIPDDVFKADIFGTKDQTKAVGIALDAEDFYRKKYAKYILLRLDLSLSENSNVKKSYTGIISVEHILPQNPSFDSIWVKEFTESERLIWIHRLGNLVLLSRRKNSSANNREFTEKLKRYFSKGITDFELTKELKNYNWWKVRDVEKRHHDLVSRVKDLYL